MKASELKYQIEQRGTNSHFFSRKTMKFFGDTMANFGVSGPEKVIDWSGEPVMCWCLYRKRATKLPTSSVYYFCVSTFRKVSGPGY